MYLEVPPGCRQHDVLDLITDPIKRLFLISLRALYLKDFEKPIDHVDDGRQFDAPSHIFVQVCILSVVGTAITVSALKVFEVPQVRNTHSGFQSRAIKRIRMNMLLELDYGVDCECAELY